MGGIGFLEVLDRRGRVRERVRIVALPTTIGRSYSNDVILDDRFVSPQHCRVVSDTDGVLTLEDLGSVNGILAGAERAPRRSLVLASGVRFRLGETVLRFVEAEHPVGEADPLTIRDGALRSLAKPGLAFPAMLSAAAVLGAQTYLSAYHDLRFTTVATDVLAGLGALSVWAGAWAFVNRLLMHRFDYRIHLAWASIIVIGAWGVSVVGEYVWFLFSAERLATTFGFVANGILFGVLLWGHLAIVPASTPSRRTSWALRSTFLFVVVSVLFAYSDRNDFSTEVPITVPLKPFGAEWAPAVSTEEFLEGVRDTKDWVDAHADR